jgi:plasmid stabilization system protein ParE
LIEYTPEARRQIADLIEHYSRLERAEAIRNLIIALGAAERRIAQSPKVGLPAPRPYPVLAGRGYLWLKAGRYWIAYRPSERPVIVGVFFETADIPNRA